MSFVKLSAGRSGHAPEVVSSHSADISHDGEISLQVRPKSANRSGSAERLDDVPLGPSSSMAEAVGSPSEGIFSVVREEAAKAMEPVSEPVEVPSGAYSDNTCSICLDDYEEGDQLLQLTCGHVFHRPCIDLWLKSHCVCPCCRRVFGRFHSDWLVSAVPEGGVCKVLLRLRGDKIGFPRYLLLYSISSHTLVFISTRIGTFDKMVPFDKKMYLSGASVPFLLICHPYGIRNGACISSNNSDIAL